MIYKTLQYNRIEIFDYPVKVKSKDFASTADIRYITVVLTVQPEE